jgi:hypothetical protein
MSKKFWDKSRKHNLLVNLSLKSVRVHEEVVKNWWNFAMCVRVTTTSFVARPKVQFSARDMPAGERKLGSTFQKAHISSKPHGVNMQFRTFFCMCLIVGRCQLHSPLRAGISFLRYPQCLLQSYGQLPHTPC